MFFALSLQPRKATSSSRPPGHGRPAASIVFHEAGQHALLRHENRFFRVVPGFVAQFGVHKDYDIWSIAGANIFILDDPPKEKNLRGTLAFAQSGPNTRAIEIFINLADNAALDAQNFVPFAKVVSGMDSVDKFYSGYGELMPEGKLIDPNRVENGTNAYLEPHFPKLDYIRRAVFLK